MTKSTKRAMRDFATIRKINRAGPRSIRASKGASGYLAVVERHKTATIIKNYAGAGPVDSRIFRVAGTTSVPLGGCFSRNDSISVAAARSAIEERG